MSSVLGCPELSDSTVLTLVERPGTLTHLLLGEVGISDRALEVLPAFCALHTLDLSWCEELNEDAPLAAVILSSATTLKRLILQCLRVGENAQILTAIAECWLLEELNLSRVACTDAAVDKIANNCLQLTSVNFSWLIKH